MDPLKQYVREQYSKVVTQANEASGTCCQATCCQGGFNEDYSQLPGYILEADYGLGCGLPTQFARLRAGQTVLDLGSGAGNDCFVVRAAVGESGKVYGLDFSEAMVERARTNNRKLGYTNVEFLLGDIEAIPLEPETVDVVVSNCVLNLVPDKARVFENIYRVLKKEGHFSISDVVTTTELPPNLRLDPHLFSDCVAGATPKTAYLQAIRVAGFTQVQIQKERELPMPRYAGGKYQLPENLRILSLTIYAEK